MASSSSCSAIGSDTDTAFDALARALVRLAERVLAARFDVLAAGVLLPPMTPVADALRARFVTGGFSGASSIMRLEVPPLLRVDVPSKRKVVLA